MYLKRTNYDEYIFSEEDINDIISSYKNGESSVKIGKKYGMSHKPILKLLHKNNIEVNQKRFVRKYNIDEHFFDIIDTQVKAYILGFLAADGSNVIKKSTISMSLEECDKEILERIRFEMKNEHPLEFIDYSNKHDFGYTYKNQYRMLIFSKHMCKQLIKLGIMPNKSNKLQFPSFLEKSLLPHYIRGIFDGDGSLGFKDINSFILKNKNNKLSISITSTYDFCLGLSNYLKNEQNIKNHLLESSNHNGITYCLYISNKDSVNKFLKWIYSDAEIYLNRKYELYKYYNSLLVA